MEKKLNQAKEHANLKIHILKLNYKKLREAWNDKRDDRIVFCNTYDMLLEACEDMKTVTNTFIWVSFNKHFKESETLLEEIAERFTK